MLASGPRTPPCRGEVGDPNNYRLDIKFFKLVEHRFNWIQGFHGSPHCNIASSFSAGVRFPYLLCRLTRIALGLSVGVYTAGPTSPPALLYASGTATVRALLIACQTFSWL